MTGTKRVTIFSGILAIALLFLSCNQTSNPTEPVERSTSLSGTEWTLLLMDGQPPIEGSNITLIFDDNTVSGYSGCNWYGAEYIATETAVSFSNVGGTVRSCDTPAGVLSQEATFISTLGQVSTYDIVAERIKLNGKVGDSSLIFKHSN